MKTDRYAPILLLLLIWSNFAVCQRNDANKTVVTPRMRIIIDNDFSGDPDGLFQLTHLLLSRSVDVRAIIGSHLRAGDGFDNSTTQAHNAARKATEVVKLLQMEGKIPIIAGSNTGMTNDSTPVRSAGVNFIIQEALRTDTQEPLYVLCGAGLTEIASAALTNPAIASKLTLVWIGGPEYPDLALPPPHYTTLEYNVGIDVPAVRAIFNRTQIHLWQVPRNAYRQALISYAQLLTRVKPHGKIGNYLGTTLEKLMTSIRRYGLNLGETYVLGDSPLVLLTALQSSFEADPASSHYVVKQAPTINAQGTYEFNPSGRNIRVYQLLDTGLMFNDFFAKLELLPKSRSQQ